MNSLTQAELAANAQTYEHIDLVMQLLLSVQYQISKRALTHDRSKLAPPEVTVFAENINKLQSITYGSEEYNTNLKEMKLALDHHYAHNRHHPDHYPNGISGMNLIDLIEMVVDWIASVRRHKDGDILKSLEINRARFNIEPQLYQILYNTVVNLTNEFEPLEFQDNL